MTLSNLGPGETRVTSIEVKARISKKIIIKQGYQFPVTARHSRMGS